MIVRVEREGDANAVHAILASAFPTPAEARLVDALRDAGRLSISLVAEADDDGGIVGHVAFSPVRLLGVDEGAGLGLAPVAVASSHRRRGIADALIRRGLEICRESGCGFVVVLGDPRYYGRFGFRPAATVGLHDEYGGGDAFQAMELRDGVLPPGGGLVRYAPEFAPFGHA